MTRIGWIALAAAATMALGGASARAANLVANGDFEANPADGLSIAGWTVSGVGIADDQVFAEGGAHDAVFTSDGSSAASLHQGIVTTPGSSYLLNFGLVNETGGLFDTFNVSFGGFSAAFGGLDAAFFYAPQSFVIQGSDITSALTTLSFSGVVSDPAFGPWNLDDVSVVATGAGVPEPGVWALMLSGFLGAGALLRRRRRLDPAAVR